MTPRPQLSLCVPDCSESKLLEEFTENVTQFFQKFPILYEVLFAVNPQQDQSLSLLKYLAERNPLFKIVENKKAANRAQNLHKLFSAAHGDVLIATDLDLAAPLSEIFKMLEALYSDKQADAVFGNRFKAKKNLEDHQALEDGIEKFFAEVIREKKPWPFADPFCPVLGLRKTGFEKIQNDLQSTGWHWTPEVQRVVATHGLRFQEIPLYVGSRKTKKPPKREALQLLRFVLFRI